MTANEYQEQCMRTAKLSSDKNMLVEGALGLSGETGEVVDLIKKHVFQGHYLPVTKLKEEIGDVLWYVSLLLFTLNVTFEECMEGNIEKLQERYPNGFSESDSKNRLN